MENKRGRPYTAEPGMRSCLPYAFPGNRPLGQGLSWARGAASKGTPKNTQSLEKACGSYYLFRHLSILQYLPSPESRRYFLPRILWGNFLVQVLWEREQSVRVQDFRLLDASLHPGHRASVLYFFCLNCFCTTGPGGPVIPPAEA